MDTPIVLPSKLDIPAVRAGTFGRPRLIQALEDAGPAMLRAIIAPTGWGKSQLLSHWLATHDKPLAFVGLDPLDNDPTRCWTHLLTALGTAADVEVGDLLNELRAPVLPLVSEIVEPVLARIGSRPLTLVLDDYHVIRSPEVQESIEALLDERASAMGACIASRTEPSLHLPRRRVRNELLEIRTNELRMTAPEAASLVRHAAQTEIEPDLVERLVERTEGWAAGLYLAGLSLRSLADHRRFVADFAGDDRNLSDYLASEVASSLDDTDRAFLLGVAVLDELEPDICNSVLGRDDAASRLDDLSRRNLFLMPVANTTDRYRFHHLFKEWLQVLLERTDSGAVTDAHGRAARAYAERGDILRAADHANAAEDWTYSHRLLMRSGLRLIDAGNHHSVSQWCSEIPDDLAPPLRFDVAAMRGWTAIIDGDLDAAARACADAEHALELTTSADRTIVSPGDIPLIRGYQQLLSGSLDSIDDTIAAAFDVGISARAEATLRWLRAARDYWIGRPDDQAFVDAATYGASQGDPFAVALSNAYLAHIHLDRSDPAGAEPWIDAAFAEITEHGLMNFGYAALAHLARGRLALGEAQFDIARNECERAVELAARRNDVFVESLARLVLAEVDHEAGERQRARSLLEVVNNDIAKLRTPGLLTERAQVLERQLRLRAQPHSRTLPTAPVEELTDREITLLRLLPGTLSQRELGEALHLSFNTVKTYNRQIYRKLGVTSRDDAVAAARRAGLL